MANEYLLQHHSSGITTRHHQNEVPLIGALKDVFAERAKKESAAGGRTKTTIVYTGSEVRRFTRQYPNLRSYLSSFISIDDNEDITLEEAEALVRKEVSIRERIDELNARGGFSTRLLAIANRRPQLERQRTGNSHHDHVVTQAIQLSKVFASNTKHKRNIARKCAKMIERYWEQIRTLDERAQRDEQRRLIRLAKRTAQQVMKKWKVVERVCEARHKEILKEMQAQEGRRHLEMILEHSEQMLGVRMEELASQKPSINEDNEEENTFDSTVSSKPLINTPERQSSPRQVSTLDRTDSPARSVASGDEFSDDEEVDEEDHIIFENDESEDDDAELDELNADQELDIEELLKKYNYRLDGSEDEDENEGESEQNIEGPMENIPEDSKHISSELTQRPAEDQINEDDATSVISMDEGSDDDRTVTVYGSDVSDIEDNNERDTRGEDINENTVPERPTPRIEEMEPKMAEQPTGTTLSTTNVNIKVPFLLRGTLREYQHVGLDWLASLYNNGLNGILADEMGLGKTIQTISLLAYLACEKGIWGPHLIVVPTSVILNWEMEFKKWLPGFKTLAYYGTPKERKEKRMGWSKENAFHVCITSYQLVIQDQNVFRRKMWQYLVLDEAHHIKNFRSQRWQVLLNFNSRRRLLLTGTPLQNNLMELWSLLYFLMPNGVSQTMPIGFASQTEFQEWFSHPVDRLIEGQQELDADSRAAIVKLHTVLRPYLLRRLKVDVEKQLPEKHEHVVYCRLSTRQRYLYDDFMSRAKTKETLSSGNFLSIINCLMQLRKVCNHPDLFEERAITTSFAMGDDIQWNGQQLETRVRKRFGVKRDLSLNLIIVDSEHVAATVASEYDLLTAAKYFLRQIAKYQSIVDVVEGRGVMSPRYHNLKEHARRYYHDFRKYYKFRQLQGHCSTIDRWEAMMNINNIRCSKRPIYGSKLIDMCESMSIERSMIFFPTKMDRRRHLDLSNALQAMVQSYRSRINNNLDLIDRYGFVTPGVVVRQKSIITVGDLSQIQCNDMLTYDILHPIRTRLSIQFPDKRLLQYDCGKLQKLDILLRQLSAGGHRALIFTQMTRVLDVLESFLNMHGYRYLRLDGATKIEQRQILTEQFNNDPRILVFILSTRSGGLGINLTGADTVIFYDSDWNPSMDKQCQDRTHRIGQTRDVHIYRFVTEYTIEENIFKKANQKRLLDNVVIQEGEFTNDYFQKSDWWRDLPEVTMRSSASADEAACQNVDFEQALLQAEDENDAQAAITARNEMDMDAREFNEGRASSSSTSPSPMNAGAPMTPGPDSESQRNYDDEEEEDDGTVAEDDDDMQLSVGHVDQYMLRFWEREIYGEYLGFGGLPEPVDLQDEEEDIVL
ncbi:SNF2 family N-terminal domain-containing protein [Dichotomocladium elegans]|nr:SNF2 family N-terminal domain-containing protein [Dichotomocladium elegans]